MRPGSPTHKRRAVCRSMTSILPRLNPGRSLVASPPCPQDRRPTRNFLAPGLPSRTRGGASSQERAQVSSGGARVCKNCGAKCYILSGATSVESLRLTASLPLGFLRPRPFRRQVVHVSKILVASACHLVLLEVIEFNLTPAEFSDSKRSLKSGKRSALPIVVVHLAQLFEFAETLERRARPPIPTIRLVGFLKRVIDANHREIDPSSFDTACAPLRLRVRFG